MINPRIDSLLEHVDSNYASVLVAAKRARQINSYYHNLGEGPSTSSRRRWSTPPRRTT
jgi:DNA-directed RNA polymerase subunit omega